MKVTVEFLKKESVNFDLECVYTLDLSRKGKQSNNIWFQLKSSNDIS